MYVSMRKYHHKAHKVTESKVGRFRAVVRGGAGGAPEFGSSVIPIPTTGGRLCPPHYC